MEPRRHHYFLDVVACVVATFACYRLYWFFDIYPRRSGIARDLGIGTPHTIDDPSHYA